MDLFDWQNVSYVIDVLIVAFVLYQVLKFAKGTRLLQVLIVGVVTVGLYYASDESLLNLATFRWLIERFWSVLLVLIIILFQDDLRALWTKIRVPHLFGSGKTSHQHLIEEIVQATRELSQKRVGALIAIQRNTEILPLLGGSVLKLDAIVSRELLFALFNPGRGNPTHDGAVLVKGDRIVAAKCILPISKQHLPAHLGMRHRAAIGLAEQTDALCVVVSEETGKISLAVEGKLMYDIGLDGLREVLVLHLSQEESESLRQRLAQRFGLKGR